jgi:hypothetical protein
MGLWKAKGHGGETKIRDSEDTDEATTNQGRFSLNRVNQNPNSQHTWTPRHSTAIPQLRQKSEVHPFRVDGHTEGELGRPMLRDVQTSKGEA